MKSRANPLLNGLSRRAQYQKMLSTCRQWAVGSSVLAIAVTFASPELYSKIASWVMAASCIGYYVHVLRQGSFVEVVSLSTDSTIPATPKVTSQALTNLSATPTIKPNLNTAYASYASPDQKTANLHLVEANRLTDEVFSKKKSPVLGDARRAGPPTTSALFGSSISPTQRPISSFASPSSAVRSPSVYHTSPIVSRSLYESRYHGYESRPKVQDSTICSMPWSNSTIRVRDALRALQLDQIKDDWVDKLRYILGKHLFSVIKMFDDTLDEISQWLIYKINGMGPTPPLNAQDIQLLIQLLGYNIDISCRKVKLSNNSTYSLEELINLLKQLSIPQEVLYRYDTASSLCKLCIGFVDMKNAASSSALFAFAQASSTGQVYDDEMYRLMISQTGNRVNKKSLIGRLKDIMLGSVDNKLRVQWSHTPLHNNRYQSQSASFSSNNASVLLTDQEVAMAVFLHKCDALAAWKPALSHLKFSHMHYAVSGKDVVKVSSQILQSSNSNIQINMKNHTFKTATESADQWCICLYLNNHPLDGDSGHVDLSNPSSSTCNSPYPHYDIYRGSLQHEHMKELLHIESSRFDVFESMIVLLLTLFYTYQYTDEEFVSRSILQRSGGASGSAAGSNSLGIAVVDYAVVKDLLREIVGAEGLEILTNIVEEDSNHETSDEDNVPVQIDYSTQTSFRGNTGMNVSFSSPI